MTDVVGKLATGPRRHFQKIQGSKLSVELRPWDGNRLYDLISLISLIGVAEPALGERIRTGLQEQD